MDQGSNHPLTLVKICYRDHETYDGGWCWRNVMVMEILGRREVDGTRTRNNMLHERAKFSDLKSGVYLGSL
jgi:hypothetical protein